MTVNPVVVDGATLQQPGPSPVPESPAPQSVPGQAAGKQQPPSDQVSLSPSRDTGFQELQQKNERSNSAAGAIRHADRSLQAMGQKVDALKAPLEAIVKNFPPFSPEDQARMKLLKQYSSLRKEIDQLTLPPPPDVVEARKAAALPAPLPMDATDSQIADHVAKLDATTASLSDTRAGMASDTAVFLQGRGFPGRFSAPGGAELGLSGTALPESGAAQKSADVGRLFATEVRQGVTAAGSQFLKRMS